MGKYGKCNHTYVVPVESCFQSKFGTGKTWGAAGLVDGNQRLGLGLVHWKPDGDRIVVGIYGF